jgi:hypothetical protein
MARGTQAVQDAKEFKLFFVTSELVINSNTTSNHYAHPLVLLTHLVKTRSSSLVDGCFCPLLA